MNVIVADQQTLRGVAATLSWTNLDNDGDATDAAGAVTVGVVRGDGTVVVAAGTATVHGGTGVYTVDLTAAQAATLDLLTATWTVAGGATFTTTCEVVGGYYFTVAEARASDATLADTTKYPSADIVAARREVEQECEFICDVAFVPRYARLTLDGSSTSELVLPLSQLRVVRSVRVYSSASVYSAFDATALAALALYEDGRVRRTDRNWFDEGVSNVVLEVEHGYGRPPADLKKAALLRLRSRLQMTKTGIPDRATTFTVAQGGTYQLSMPGRYRTGIPEVDAVYARYSERDLTEPKAVPASASYDLDPARRSLYHGGRR